MVVHWTTRAYVSKKLIPLTCLLPLAQNRALNVMMHPSGYRLHLNIQVLGIT